MWVELNADNGLHLCAEMEDGYDININLNCKNKPFKNLNSIIYNLFNDFNIKENVIYIKDDNDRILITIHEDNE